MADKYKLAAEEALLPFAQACLQRGIYGIKVWVGFTLCFGKYTVCYSGNLTSCEKAEDSVIGKVSKQYPNACFCYVYPSHWSARTVEEIVKNGK